MAVGGVGHEHVDAGLDQRGRALPGVAEVADGRTHHEAAVAVLAGVRELLGLHEVLDRDEPGEAAAVVDDREPLALVLAQQQRGLVPADPLVPRDERHRRHDVGHEGVRPLGDGREAQVAVGHDAEQDVVLVDDRQAGDAVLAAALVELLEGGLRVDRDRVGDHPGLGPLHEVDLVGLVLDREVAVQHAEAALARHRDRHPRLGHGVHRGGDQRHAQRDLTGQPRGRVDLGRDDVGLAREQQDVVVGETERSELLGDAVGVGHEEPSGSQAVPPRGSPQWSSPRRTTTQELTTRPRRRASAGPTGAQRRRLALALGSRRPCWPRRRPGATTPGDGLAPAGPGGHPDLPGARGARRACPRRSAASRPSPRLARSEEAPAEAEGDGLGAVGGGELAEQPARVGLDGVLGQVQLAADLGVGLPRATCRRAPAARAR